MFTEWQLRDMRFLSYCNKSWGFLFKSSSALLLCFESMFNEFLFIVQYTHFWKQYTTVFFSHAWFYLSMIKNSVYQEEVRTKSSTQSIDHSEGHYIFLKSVSSQWGKKLVTLTEYKTSVSIKALYAVCIYKRSQRACIKVRVFIREWRGIHLTVNFCFVFYFLFFVF